MKRLWRRMESSLQARILLPTAILFTLTITAMVLWAIFLHRTDLENTQRERAGLFGAMAAGRVMTEMLEGHATANMDELLSEMAGDHPDIEVISLIGPSGEVAFSSRPELVKSRPWPELRRFVDPTFIANPTGNQLQFALLQPIRNEEACTRCHGPVSKTNGYLDLRFTRRAAATASKRLAGTLVFAAAPALVILLAIAWWLLGREATRPLHRLVSAMRRAGAGEKILADEGRPDELGVAARSFDTMMSELRRSNAEVESLYREHMERADRLASVGELAASLSHEIKNPLAGLSGALELLANDLREPPARVELIAEMRRQVGRLICTMESLLSFARPPKVDLRAIDVNPTIARVLLLVGQQSSKSSQVKITTDLAPRLPLAMADSAQLEQVLLNLCLNAVQAMNGTSGTLTARTFVDREQVVMEVADSGPGIPVDVRPHIFKPFFTTKRQGSGLGLAISARIVADHRGKMRYYCPPWGGTVFRVSLPAVLKAQGAT